MGVRGAVTSESARRRFSEMVLPHLDDAYGLARWLTGNRTDAEDVVQDACMRALASLDTATIERPRAWMLTIVRNTAFTWLAKNRPNTVLVTDDAQLLEAAAAKATSPPPTRQRLNRRSRRCRICLGKSLSCAT